MEDMRAFLADKRRRFWTGLEGAESKTIIIFDSNNQIEQIHCGKKIWEIQRTLKPYQNKKGQSFVVMLAFCVYFFWIGISCLLQKKKRRSITTNVWSLLFCQSFTWILISAHSQLQTFSGSKQNNERMQYATAANNLLLIAVFWMFRFDGIKICSWLWAEMKIHAVYSEYFILPLISSNSEKHQRISSLP